MPQSTVNFDAAMKDNYGPGLRNAVNNSNVVATEVGTNTEDIVGRQAVWSVHTSRSGSTGARQELAALPIADRQRFSKLQDDLASLYHTIKVSGQAKWLTQGDNAAFARALESEISGAEKDIKSDYARQMFGQSISVNSVVVSGVIASVASSTGTTITLGTAADDEVALSASEVRYFFQGMKLNVINGSTGASRGSCIVTSITAAGVLTVDSTPGGTADEDFICRDGNLGNEINGLRFLINTTSVYAGIDPATVSQWKPVSVGSSTTPVSEVLFDQASEGVETDGDGDAPGLYVSDHSQRRKLASQMQAQKRYDGKETTLKAGWRGLQISYGTLVADRFCPTTIAFGISTDEMETFIGLDWTWDEDDGKVLFKALDGSDAVEARFKTYRNLEATNRNSHVLITMVAPTF